MVKRTTCNTDDADAPYKRGAAIDAIKRNQQAVKDNPSFFKDPARVAKMTTLERTLNKHYSIKHRRWTNNRPGGKGHQPAFEIKIENPFITPTKLANLEADVNMIDPAIELKENLANGNHIWIIR